jgi:hypothetical protein
MVVNAVRNEKLLVLGPTIELFDQRISSSPSGSPWASAVSCLCGEPYPIWLSKTMNVGRPFVCWKTFERIFDSAEIVGIADAQNIPAVSEKTRGHVFGECNIRVPFDADVIVVVDPTEVIETR